MGKEMTAQGGDERLSRDYYFMGLALEKAKEAFDNGEVPVGAVIVRGEEILGFGRNRVERHRDVTAHAEMEAIRQSQQRVGDWRLDSTTLYVTKEPCLMCWGAVFLSRIERVVFGISDPKQADFCCIKDFFTARKKPEILPGVRSQESLELMHQFFFILRNKKRELPRCNIGIS
ncbi:nucleoside deaminase [Candidatus Methylacidiphilum infernorum]|uniref:Cytosine/adenosine deaminase n=1 Tax=Methylacidiphilum infernorum (isolate V4) TaxID=481448 RepID=B3DZQ1_METI4|nr:nucleoside deaminase [Candidatus Methylacidiphilum infernorum]ACD84236.1 Cytosine/adenosine deaminase [Methylacidiphilum infernorum V4]